MNKKLFKYAFVWGVVLWFIGYVLGIVLFPFVPNSILGWIIMPIGILLTLWVLFKKIKTNVFRDYIVIAFTWMILAIILDYFLLVKVFKPEDGYYKLDIYVYYILTLILPLSIGWRKSNRSTP